MQLGDLESTSKQFISQQTNRLVKISNVSTYSWQLINVLQNCKGIVLWITCICNPFSNWYDRRYWQVTVTSEKTIWFIWSRMTNLCFYYNDSPSESNTEINCFKSLIHTFLCFLPNIHLIFIIQKLIEWGQLYIYWVMF